MIKCTVCNYSFSSEETAEYTSIDKYVHAVSSPAGYYSFFEPHNMRFVQTSDMYTHNCLCLDCGIIYTDAHTWVQTSSGYRCTKCLKTSTIIPDIMGIIPDDELAALLADLSDEELAELTLALNEEDRGRIAALLPEREDDLVTE